MPQNPQVENLISKEMTIDEIFTRFPHRGQRLAQEMSQAGLHCVGCHAATWETLEAGMLGHGMNEAQMDQLLSRLNAILSEEHEKDSIVLTPRAAQKFLAILRDEGKQGWSLRFSEKLAGCSGYEFILDFSEKAEKDDEIFHSQGVDIHVKKSMRERLIGSQIDYIEGLQNAGFKVSNPNVRSSCGCGTSHGY